MRTYAYDAVFEPGDEHATVVSFPDVPEAITEGRDVADAQGMAADALGLALLAYLKQGRPLPAPAGVPGGIRIGVDAETAAKLAVLEAFRDSGLTKTELARRLGKDEKEVRRILDPMHPTKLASLVQVLAELGRRLVVSVEENRAD